MPADPNGRRGVADPAVLFEQERAQPLFYVVDLSSSWAPASAFAASPFASPFALALALAFVPAFDLVPAVFFFDVDFEVVFLFGFDALSPPSASPLLSAALAAACRAV